MRSLIYVCVILVLVLAETLPVSSEPGKCLPCDRVLCILGLPCPPEEWVKDECKCCTICGAKEFEECNGAKPCIDSLTCVLPNGCRLGSSPSWYIKAKGTCQQKGDNEESPSRKCLNSGRRSK